MNNQKNQLLLRKLKSLIRVGWSEITREDSKPDPLGDSIQDIVDELERWAERAPTADQLQYRLLCAEFEYAFGRQRSAAEKLNRLVERLKLRDALRENQLLAKDHPRKRAAFKDAQDTVTVLRRKVWALMGALFYYDYSQRGEVETTIKLLHALKNVAGGEMRRLRRRDKATPGRQEYEPHGTRLQIFLFLAQIYRSQFLLEKSAQYFVDAQEEAELRLERELRNAETPERRSIEVQFTVNATVRVMGGLGKLAILEGRLSQARNLLRCCLTLLKPTGQVPLYRVIKSHLLIAERRSHPPGSDAWVVAVGAIENMFRVDFKLDFDGKRRCAQDLARAHLELAEALSSTERQEEHKRALDKAWEWIQRLLETAQARGRESGHAERCRAYLLSTRYHLLQPFPDIPAAEAANIAAVAEERASNTCTLDLSGFDPVRPGLTAALLAHAKAIRDVHDKEAVGLAVRAWEGIIGGSQANRDRLLECEAWLRLAQLKFERKNVGEARVALERGERLQLSIENASMASLVVNTQAMFKQHFEIPPGAKVPEAKNALERQMIIGTYVRLRTYEATHMELGVSVERIKEVIEETFRPPRPPTRTSPTKRRPPGIE